MLNSFWGKFGENLRKSSMKAMSNPAQLYEVVSDPLKTVTSIHICNEDLLEVVFTSPGLKLYSYLKVLGEQVLYFDTDSVIYAHKPGQAEVPNRDFLGELTNELEPGDHIVDFTSGGPKNYGYTTTNGKVECKVCGFTLHNVRGSQQLNYN